MVYRPCYKRAVLLLDKPNRHISFNRSQLLPTRSNLFCILTLRMRIDVCSSLILESKQIHSLLLVIANIVHFRTCKKIGFCLTSNFHSLGVVHVAHNSFFIFPRLISKVSAMQRQFLCEPLVIRKKFFCIQMAVKAGA